MSTPVQPDASIPSQIYELASIHRIGTPIKKPKRRMIQILLTVELLVGIALLGVLGYFVYEELAFISLSHIYPTVNSVPDNQLDNYSWLQAFHDSFWPYLLQAALQFFVLLSLFFPAFRTYRTKLYFCTDGLLKISRKKEEAVRWDEVKEFYTVNGRVTRLVKQEGSGIFLPILLIDKAFTALIVDEVTRCLLPGMLASYEQGESVAFGDLIVSQKGIYRPGNMVYWKQIGDIALEKRAFSIYYSGLDNAQDGKQAEITFVGKWRTWRKSRVGSLSWPNLPIFVALVTAILDQQSVVQREEGLLSSQVQTVREIAALAKRKRRRRKRVAIALASLSVLGALSLAIGIPIAQSIQEQERAQRDTQLLLNFYTQRAHKPYAVHVPGEQCGNGKEYWLNDDSQNVYTCQQNGLLMTQKNFQYQDGEYFTFVDDTLSMSHAFASGHYFPHHYRVQVHAAIVSGGPGTCAAVEVHIQDFQGRQMFEVCADGSWRYSRCDLHCNTDTLEANGQLAHAQKSYLIALDVSDKSVTLLVDDDKVDMIQDSAYTFTDQLELALDGDQNAGELVTALFSDFSYTPL